MATPAQEAADCQDEIVIQRRMKLKETQIIQLRALPRIISKAKPTRRLRAEDLESATTAEETDGNVNYES